METVLVDAPLQRQFYVEDMSAVADIRRHAIDMAHWLNFDENACGEVAIAISEAITNIVKHAGHGEILLRTCVDRNGAALEVIALDKGPGLSDLDAALRDGVSTTGTSGTGLGAMKRLATEFDIYSQRDKGTALYLRMAAKSERNAPSLLQLGVVSVAKRGEEACGDGWGIYNDGGHYLIAVADGLGHGIEAAKAARAVLSVINQNPLPSLTRLLDLAHLRARATRGAALSFASLQTNAQFLQYVGIGNIASCIYRHGQRRQLLTHNGIVGHNIRKIQETVSEWGEDALLIMHSDGLLTQWSLEQYPGLSLRHPALIASVLYRDFNRNSDDVTVLVIRMQH